MKKLTTSFCLLIATFLPLTACSEAATSTDDKPVRLVITEDKLLFDGKELDFEAPFSEWLEVLGYAYLLHGEHDRLVTYFDDRVYFPDYGIEVQLARNPAHDDENKTQGEPFFILKNVKERPVYAVWVNLIPRRKTKNIQLDRESRINGVLDTEFDDIKRIRYFHPRYTGYGDYAVDFFGAIITDQTTLEEMVEMSKKKESLFSWNDRYLINNSSDQSDVFATATFSRRYEKHNILSIRIESSNEVALRANEAYQQRIKERKAREKAEAELNSRS